ncbi:hypothetical protein BCR34DRAFT_568883 [Clohesyomyces aquaticus]|uniref:Uncharacterized protein n=1 Tax=Clohesyomyces aquaticus TaxID=1231657 RepID=A0A1Y1ZFW6_9PLEO|nr:hypothetical protein BCR34DRAFT_568883 [Clohesyomyces aquaticus]
MMFKTTTVLCALSLLLSSTLAAPAGSKKNIYLLKCEPNECPIGVCEPDEFTVTAAALFRNGPVKAGATTAKPDVLALLSGYRPKWEGTRRTVRLGTEGTLTTNISAGAASLPKSQIAGDATLGNENLVCFKDGSTTFGITYEGDRYTCTTTYWCPSIEV